MKSASQIYSSDHDCRASHVRCPSKNRNIPCLVKRPVSPNFRRMTRLQSLAGNVDSGIHGFRGDEPPLPYPAWRETCTTLHLWTQIVGKIRLSQTPWLNHSWHVALYMTARGLTTSPIPLGERVFQIDFDFIDHLLRIETSDGRQRQIPLRAQSVADFYVAVVAALAALRIRVRIGERPNEVPVPIGFSEDKTHAAYDAEYACRFWRILLQVDRLFKLFRTGFIGKCSPVHFFWGSFDLAVTRFSGRPAPLHPGGIPNLSDEVTREAYSHEVSSAGFWPGNGGTTFPAFSSYAYPAPKGFAEARVAPEGAYFDQRLGEFLLPYEVVQKSNEPEATLMAFLESTYRAAADLAGW